MVIMFHFLCSTCTRIHWLVKSQQHSRVLVFVIVIVFVFAWYTMTLQLHGKIQIVPVVRQKLIFKFVQPLRGVLDLQTSNPCHT